MKSSQLCKTVVYFTQYQGRKRLGPKTHKHSLNISILKLTVSQQTNNEN